MEMTINWLGLEPHSKEIPQDSQNKLIECLSEDPEDHPAGFIIIIERHNASLTKAHLLLEATRDIIQKKWMEGTTLDDIGKFLQSWAPEPYRNKTMPKGMIQALLNITPNSRHGPLQICQIAFSEIQKPQTLSTTWLEQWEIWAH